MIEIADAVRKTGMWNDRPLRFERIATGITNLNWRIRLLDTDEIFFLKIHGAGTDNLIDRKLAHEAAVKAAKSGIAPELLFYDGEDGIEVYEFLQGFRSCGVRDLQNPVVRENVLSAYRSIHSTQSLSVTKTGFDQLQQNYSRARSAGAEFPRDMEQIFWQVERASNAISASGMTTCACFNDGYVYNYMVNDKLDVKIIDWEYASANDPYWDLAMFSLEGFFLDRESIQKTLELYDGQSRKDTAARVYLYGGVALVVWSLWATYQSATSSIAFDFGKYADILMMRARHSMLCPEWDNALSSV